MPEKVYHICISVLCCDRLKIKVFFNCMSIGQYDKETLLREVIGFDLLQVLW